MVLFTDGRANYGIKDPSALSKATRYIIKHSNTFLLIFIIDQCWNRLVVKCVCLH